MEHSLFLFDTAMEKFQDTDIRFLALSMLRHGLCESDISETDKARILATAFAVAAKEENTLVSYM